MKQDAELLSEYVREGSEAAFAELVKRHLSLVYHAALRHTGGNGALAEEAAQIVFSDLARKAPALVSHQTLVGWLFKSAHYASAKLAREAQRRKAREEKAGQWEAIMRDDQDVFDWEKLKPVIDEALLKLGDKDRQALLMRFFEGRTFSDLGRALGLSEDGARMRVDRALERVRLLLARRKITSTSAALGTLLAAQASAAVPSGLAATVTGSALANTAGAGALASLLTFMSTTKIQAGLACLVIAAGATGVAMQQRELSQEKQTASQTEQSSAELSQLRLETSRLERQLALEEQERSEAAQLAGLREALQTRKAALVRKTILVPASGAQESETRAYQVRELDVIPRAVHQSPPSYPASLRFDGIKGEAMVSFEISEDGLVRKVGVTKCTDEEFGEAAASAVALWKFSPGMLKGKAVPVRMQVPIVFNITEDAQRTSRPTTP